MVLGVDVGVLVLVVTATFAVIQLLLWLSVSNLSDNVADLKSKVDNLSLSVSLARDQSLRDAIQYLRAGGDINTNNIFGEAGQTAAGSKNKQETK